MTIIAGSILFSIVGYMTKPTWLALSLETLVALLLLVSSYAIMVVNSLVLDGILILITSFAMTSVSAPVGTM